MRRLNPLSLLLVILPFSCSETAQDANEADADPTTPLSDNDADPTATPSDPDGMNDAGTADDIVSPALETPDVVAVIDEDIYTEMAPCDFELSAVAENETRLIDCVIDLKGAAVAIAKGVTLDFAGGDIYGGTLNFAGAGIIDGRILSHRLELEGDVKLKDPLFEFRVARWEIVEGMTDSESALANNTNLELLFNRTKELGATTFAIDRLDIYLEVSRVTSTTSNQNFYPTLEALNVPGDFHLAMSDNTFLRVLPTANSGGMILAVRDVSNAIITGGNLVGDRDEHLYSTPRGDGLDVDEGQHLLALHAARNVLIDGVTLSKGSLGALNINSLGFTFNDDYIPTDGVVVRNCVFRDNRRMSMAITDGYNMLLENNVFENTGLDDELSIGGEVGYAINIEALRDRDDAGELRFYEKAQDIVIRGNQFSGSRVGDLTISIGERVLVEDNQFTSKLVYSLTNGTRIRNNTFTYDEQASADTAAMSVGGSISETVFDNEISGNTYIGFGLAINATHRNLRLIGNKFEECGIAIKFKDVENMVVKDNVVTSTEPSSQGFFFHLTSADNIVVSNNVLSVDRHGVSSVALNEGDEQQDFLVTFENNQILTGGGVSFARSTGVLFTDNTIKAGLQINASSKLDIHRNTFEAGSSHGIDLGSNVSDTTFTENDISFPGGTNFDCYNDEDAEVTNVVFAASNTCTEL